MKNITKIITTILIITVFAIVVQSYPADVYDPNEIDAVMILPDYTPPAVYTTPPEIEPEPEIIPEIEIVANITYDDLHYNETTPDNVQEFLDNIPPCPWFKDSAANMCSSNARYIAIEAKEHGLDIGECTIVDTDTSRIKRTLMGGHRVNVFEYDGVKYFTTNLNKYHSDVVTAPELYSILNDLMRLERLGTKDYNWV